MFVECINSSFLLIVNKYSIVWLMLTILWLMYIMFVSIWRLLQINLLWTFVYKSLNEHVFSSLVQVPRNKTTKAYGQYKFNFSGNCQLVLQSACTILLFPPAILESSTSSTFLPLSRLASILVILWNNRKNILTSAPGSWHRALKIFVMSWMLGVSFVLMRQLWVAPGWGRITRKKIHDEKLKIFISIPLLWRKEKG